ncbi:hypothetical protein FD754_013673 [Muntiacus muntjak]|uniref:G-protein coupled receptors family 1 profile domain-containing protein n=1 Tax=Muntiacus muntjak TaxID=9888 RepID=A0A5N3VL92_MUNMU|nr:hypothetical protein FD754_013673 [Muntiacus muntjak]
MVLNTTASEFLLTGFPGTEKAHHWISIPLLVVYISILLGSGTLLVLIRDYHDLHEPMCYFLAMLAATNRGVTLTMMPKVLGILWLNHREISHRACFSQAYFIHTLSIIEYTSILTNSRVIKIRMGVLIRTGLSIIPIILCLPWFPYCSSHVLSHTFCLHQDVINLPCANIIFSRLYPVVVAFTMVLLDFLVIFFSYILILKTLMGIASGEERAKDLNTSAAPWYSMSLSHAPHAVHIMVSHISFLFPPFMNLVIYSIKTKQVQTGIIRFFSLLHSRV